MNRSAVALVVALLFVPAVSHAATDELYQTVMHLLGQIAALKAQAQGAALACEVVAPANGKAGEPFPLIWNSVGAREPGSAGMSDLPRGNVVMVVKEKPGRYKYDLDFYSPSGEKTSCATYITIR